MVCTEQNPLFLVKEKVALVRRYSPERLVGFWRIRPMISLMSGALLSLLRSLSGNGGVSGIHVTPASMLTFYRESSYRMFPDMQTILKEVNTSAGHEPVSLPIELHRKDV